LNPAIITTNTIITNKPLLQAKNPTIITPENSEIIENISERKTVIKSDKNTIFIEKMNKKSQLLAINYIKGKLFKFIPVSIILKGMHKYMYVYVSTYLCVYIQICVFTYLYTYSYELYQDKLLKFIPVSIMYMYVYFYFFRYFNTDILEGKG
jgi:hypothetical protein